MLPDLRFAFRQLVKSPGFTATAVLTLALGIGACTAMFSIVHAVLWKPLPFREPDRLVWIENNLGGGLSHRTTRADTFNGWREQNRSFESLAAYFAFSDFGTLLMSGTGEPQRLRDVGVSDNFLTTLGISLLHGRNFTAEECAWQGPGAAILSHACWQRRFGGDPAVVGRTITLNNAPRTIVGVLPRSFDFDAIFTPGSEVDLLSPFPLTPETARWGNTVFGIGRLKSGVSATQSQAELMLISERLRESTLKNVGKFGAVVRPLGDAMRGKFRGAFLLLTGAVGCVLAIACVNLSNLLLARVNARRQEFATRVALGALRIHLVRQTLTESLLLSFAGSVVAVPVAVWATSTLAGLHSFGVPLLQEAAMNPLALAVTIGLTTLAGVVCGVLPALHVAQAHRGVGVQNATHQRSAGRTSVLARNGLVVAEVALACVLLVGAGLLLRSFHAVLQVDLGFQPQRAMAWRLDLPRRFNSLEEANRYVDGAVQRVATLPGVEAVGVTDALPLGRNRTWGAGAKGVKYAPGEFPTAYPRMVDEHYLRAMQIPLRAGRMFDARDSAQGEKTIVINENLARKLWPGRDPIGQMMAQSGGSKVIGVVANVRHGSLEEAGDNEMYLSYRQNSDWTSLEMVVRSARPMESLVTEIRAALAAHDPAMPNSEYRLLDQLIDNAVAPRRLMTELLTLFSALALTLAALGLYGVVAYSVVQRTQEIGIRMAIGAQRVDVVKLILAGGLKLVVLGVAIGLAGAFALTRVLQSLLFGVSATDPLVFAGNAALLTAVATAACVLPALRATRVDPLVALRTE